MSDWTPSLRHRCPVSALVLAADAAPAAESHHDRQLRPSLGRTVSEQHSIQPSYPSKSAIPRWTGRRAVGSAEGLQRRGVDGRHEESQRMEGSTEKAAPWRESTAKSKPISVIAGRPPRASERALSDEAGSRDGASRDLPTLLDASAPVKHRERGRSVNVVSPRSCSVDTVTSQSPDLSNPRVEMKEAATQMSDTEDPGNVGLDYVDVCQHWMASPPRAFHAIPNEAFDIFTQPPSPASPEGAQHPRPSLDPSTCLPPSNCWDWPLSRQEKKARLLLVERRMDLLDRSTLLQELRQLRSAVRRRSDPVVPRGNVV